MADAGTQTGRQPRADARRNRARVLRAAEEAFATEGADVPLDEVARRAGVGAGTVYRHFPSKNALLEAVIVHRVARMAADTRAMITADDPGGAFFTFFAEMVERVTFNKALAAALDGRAQIRPATTSGLKREFREAVAALLLRAQQAGAVRADVDEADVVALATGCIAMEASRNSSGRMVALTCDALRPAAASELPAATTAPEWEPTPPDHDESVASVRNETREGFCPVCTSPLPAAATGRPRRYCSDACRQKAHRLRAR
ncbi:helix-turn-helix domain-containing protein [Streptomyces sp. NPDC021356]|uniref:TetR/AcrR family transcriptional regulator n=1 Tax=Streptomyces sp. NPDC021356 TaxID=3154900 RepID=UPI0033EF6B65